MAIKARTSIVDELFSAANFDKELAEYQESFPEMTREVLEEIWESERSYFEHLERELDGIFAARTAREYGQKERSMTINVRNTEQGVRVARGHSFFRKVCEGWLGCMNDYDKRVPNDWPFWYGERPLLGFFAAGVWRAGGICMEEYSTDKKAERFDGGPPQTYLGRGDFYYKYRGQEGDIEFKMYNVGISQPGHFESFLKRKWGSAHSNAASGHRRGVPSHGGLFLRPYVGKDKDTKAYNENLKQLIQTAWETLRPDALAWWCPVERVLTNQRHTNDWIVGAILIVKRAK